MKLQFETNLKKYIIIGKKRIQRRRRRWRGKKRLFSRFQIIRERKKEKLQTKKKYYNI